MNVHRRILIGVSMSVIVVSMAGLMHAQIGEKHAVSAEQYQRWKTELSNWGRWGKEDQIGALNLITPAKRRQAATLVRDAGMFTNSGVVKVVVALNGRALYFSRSLIPHVRDVAASGPDVQQFGFLRHLGVYGYRREALLRLVRWPVSPLEAAEKLEQLRALENGLGIHVVRVEDEGIGVDTPEDVARVEALLERRGQGSLPAANATGV